MGDSEGIAAFREIQPAPSRMAGVSSRLQGHTDPRATAQRSPAHLLRAKREPLPLPSYGAGQFEGVPPGRCRLAEEILLCPSPAVGDPLDRAGSRPGAD